MVPSPPVGCGGGTVWPVCDSWWCDARIRPPPPCGMWWWGTVWPVPPRGCGFVGPLALEFRVALVSSIIVRFTRFKGLGLPLR